MKNFLLSLLLVPTLVMAQQKTIRLYENNESSTVQEKINNSNAEMPLVYNITIPTLTVSTPDSLKSNGTGIVVAPGGGFMFLNIKSEGSDVAKWLVEKGFTVFLLKYRTLPLDTDDPMRALQENYNNHKWEDLIKNQISICAADGRAAIAYVRTHATEYQLKPNRIGIIGFSAGGTVAATTAFDYNKNNRPNFVAPIYPYFPDYMQKTVLTDAPPMFLLAASNDEGGFNLHCISLYKHWVTNKKLAELHLYVSGGHGFGMMKQNLPKDNWIERFYEFLQGQDFTDTKNSH